MKLRPTCYKMTPDKLQNGAQCSFSKFDRRLFISKVFQSAFYMSLSLSVFSTSLAQLAASVANSRLTLCWMCDWPRMRCVKNNTHIHVARTSRNRMSTRCDLCATTIWNFAHLPLGFSNHNKVVLLCIQDVKVILGASWTADPRHNCNRDTPLD